MARRRVDVRVLWLFAWDRAGCTQDLARLSKTRRSSVTPSASAFLGCDIFLCLFLLNLLPGENVFKRLDHDPEGVLAGQHRRHMDLHSFAAPGPIADSRAHIRGFRRDSNGWEYQICRAPRSVGLSILGNSQAPFCVEAPPCGWNI